MKAQHTGISVLGRRSYVQREQGSRDWRMAILALCMWMAMLAAHALLWSVTGLAPENFSSAGEQDSFPAWPWLVRMIVAAAIVVVLLAVVLEIRRGGMRHLMFRVLPHPDFCQVSLWLTVLACGVGVAASAGVEADMAQLADPAMALSRGGKSEITATLKVTAPVIASKSWQADCQTNGTLREIAHDGVAMDSHVDVQLFMDGGACTSVVNGAVVVVLGTVEPAKYGSRPIWLTVQQESRIETVKPPGGVRRIVNGMQESFVDATHGLSDQGKVLVPGLTIGVLGQDFVSSSDVQDASSSVDDTFATLLEQYFKRSGIMHLMAVSGGHFALILGLVRKVCFTLLLPRRITALATAFVYLALAAVVYPSDSVLRALVMGLFSAAAMCVGRRSQALDSLAWTVIVVLAADPAMSRSFGFALSSASVLGIVLWSKPLSAILGKLLPSVLAESVSLTVAAQLLTLPIQVLMSPELPVLSIPANLVVAPFVDFSTMTGLASLMVSSLCEPLGFALAWLSSCGTAVMQWCADTIGSSQSAVVPWSGGAAGSMMILVLEALIAVLWREGVRLLSKSRSHDGSGAYGSTFTVGWRGRCSSWLRQAREMFESRDWDS